MLTFATLQAEVGEWSRRNFPDNTPRDPFEGLCEEFGELAHARLKSRQGIRGTTAEHEAAEKDALADVIIYACDYAERRSVQLADLVATACERIYGDPRDDNAIGTLQQFTHFVGPFDDPIHAYDHMLSDLFTASYDSVGVGELLIDLCAYADLRGFDLESIVAETWAQVRQRDWRKDPANGGLSANGEATPSPPQVKVMDFARGEIVTLPTAPNGVVR